MSRYVSKTRLTIRPAPCRRPFARPSPKRWVASWAGLAWCFVASGCGALLHSVDDAPAPPVPVTDAFRQAKGVKTSSVAQGRWWTTFEDQGLNAVMRAAITENLDLKRASARMKQAQAIRRGANSAWFPQIDISANASRSKSAFQFGSFENSQYDLSAAASYELDLWGRINFTTTAAALDFKATEFDLETVAMTVSAQVAETWFQLVEQRATLALLQRQLKTNQTFLELVELRFGQGQVSSVDVYQQRQLVASIEGQLPPVNSAIAVLEHRLAVLLARSPGDPSLPTGEMLPSLPPPPAIGLPATLLKRRPDVQAAQARVMAADNRIGAAIADQFPTLRLSASGGFRSFTDPTDLFDNFIWNIAGGLAGPLFDGLRRRAEVDRTKAVLEDQLLAYGQTVLTAFQEVEDALVQERQQRGASRRARQAARYCSKDAAAVARSVPQRAQRLPAGVERAEQSPAARTGRGGRPAGAAVVSNSAVPGARG